MKKSIRKSVKTVLTICLIVFCIVISVEPVQAQIDKSRRILKKNYPYVQPPPLPVPTPRPNPIIKIDRIQIMKDLQIMKERQKLEEQRMELMLQYRLIYDIPTIDSLLHVIIQKNNMSDSMVSFVYLDCGLLMSIASNSSDSINPVLIATQYETVQSSESSVCQVDTAKLVNQHNGCFLLTNLFSRLAIDIDSKYKHGDIYLFFFQNDSDLYSPILSQFCTFDNKIVLDEKTYIEVASMQKEDKIWADYTTAALYDAFRENVLLDCEIIQGKKNIAHVTPYPFEKNLVMFNRNQLSHVTPYPFEKNLVMYIWNWNQLLVQMGCVKY